MRSHRGWARRVSGSMCALTVALLSQQVMAEEAPAADAPTTAPATSAPDKVEHPAIGTRLPHGRRIPYTSEAVLNERVKLLTAELDLTEAQQVDVRALLVRQGDAIRRVWTDRSLTDGERVPITSAIGEKTADAIRDLLTSAQREKYNPPRPDPTRSKPEAAKDLSKWLDAFHQK